MKKKNLSSLVLRKNKVSNLNRLPSLVGGSETVPPDENAPSNAVTAVTICGTCQTLCDVSGCITNDKTRSLRPTVGVACNGLNTGEEC